MNLANDAKNIKEYTVANIIFALLTNSRESSYFKGLLSIEYETDGGDTYYDLFVLRLKRSKLSICIPVPLMRVMPACALLQKAKIVYRREHNREVIEDATISDNNQLWIRLTELSGMSIDKLLTVRNNVLDLR